MELSALFVINSFQDDNHTSFLLTQEYEEISCGTGLSDQINEFNEFLMSRNIITLIDIVNINKV